jgi:hypothetical protein
MDAVVCFIALVTCAFEAALLCKLRNKQTTISRPYIILFTQKNILAERNSVRYFFRNDCFQERTDNKYKSKICVDAP